MVHAFLTPQQLLRLRFGTTGQSRRASQEAARQFQLLVFDQPRNSRGLPRLGPQVTQWLRYLKTLKTDSVNGLVGFAELKQGDSKLLVKTEKTVAPQPGHVQDPLDYEFVIQAALNELRPRIPHFSYGFALFTCPGEIRDGQILNVCETRREGPMLKFLLSEAVVPGREFGELLEFERASDVSFLAHMVQVFMALQIAQDTLQFTHYDLHAGNVLMQSLSRCCPGVGTDTHEVLFEYSYRGTLVWVPARYVCTIIDFGRSHLPFDKRRETGRRYKFSRAVWDPEQFYRDIDGVKGTTIRRFNRVFDMVRFYGGVYDEASSSFKSQSLIEKYYRLMITEFPDYPDDGFTERTTSPRLKEPMDWVRLILNEPRMQQEIARLRQSGASVFRWNSLKNRSKR